MKGFFFFFFFIKTHNIEIRFVTEPPEYTFSRRVCAFNFQPGNSTGWSSEGVNGSCVSGGHELCCLHVYPKDLVHTVSTDLAVLIASLVS